MTRVKIGLLLCVMALLTIAIVPAQAQDTINLTLAIADFNEDAFRFVADQFEAQYPNVRVHLESYGELGDAISGQGEVDDYLDDVEALVSSADVVPISNTLYPEATRAGYLLNLAPLANSDTTLNSADFYPAMWEAFQWDGGIWGIPVAGSISTIYYNPVAFDEARVPYPNENWTLTDFDSAIRALTQYNTDGSVALPGFVNFGAELEMIFASLIGNGIANDTLFPSAPNFNNPALENALTLWANLQADGLMDFPQTDDFDINSVPMVAGGGFLAGGGRGAVIRGGGGNNATSESLERLPAYLPGGHVGLNTSGYGVSSGTLNPELAYELATFLSNSPEIVGTFFDADLPARRSLIGVEGAEIGDGGFRFEQASSPEIDAFNQVAVESAVSSAEVRFMTQIEDVISNMINNNIDAPTALDELEVDVLERLQIADDRALTTQIVVTPPAITTLAEGEIALNFGISGFVQNEDQWQTIADEFAMQDPEIGVILVDTVDPREGNLDTIATTYDCFYQDTNIVPNADLTLLRNIDPLLSTDPTFNPNDIVTGVLAQLQNNGQTWGYPLNIQPLVMRYNPDVFAQAGAFPPSGTWSVAEFEDALRTVGNFVGADASPFQPQAFDNAYLLNLIASYGGLPIDTRTTPATYNFTDPANVEAIRQVLDLAVNGFMDYNELATVGGRIQFTIGRGEDGENPVPIYTETLSGFGFGGGGRVFIVGGGDIELPENTDLIVTFPTGSQFNAVSYDIGTAYISALTPHTDPCYRFISALGQNPDLFPSMPANRALINTPDFVTAQGQNAVNFYNSLDNLLSQPNTIALPTFSGRGGVSLEATWLNQVFDQYVAGEIQDLDSALAEAEGFTLAYQECTANIPPFDPASGENPREFFEQTTECATQVDPTVADLFPTFGN